ncbi:MAG TPA: M20/M25/M40 family metallo-hydrolase, partial [Gemmatimonadales bacterium]
PEFDPADRRTTLDDLINPPPPRTPGGQGGGFGGGFRLNTLISAMLRREQPAAVLQPSAWTYGMFLSGGHFDGRTARDSVYNPTPNLIVAHEQYGTLWRVAQRGMPARIEFNLQTRFLDDNRYPANVTAEIAGTDKASEVVMLGAHFDSWHGGTGATDNGAGSVVMMEALRILKTIGLPMRRTVRIGLWTGEEQGLIGSRKYAEAHAAEADSMQAVVVLDNGVGAITGQALQSRLDLYYLWRELLNPVHDLHADTVTDNNKGGTDHLSFLPYGVPGFNFNQITRGYNHTHHSQSDTYDKAIDWDLRQASTVMAVSAFELANLNGMIPRGQKRTVQPMAAVRVSDSLMVKGSR